MTRGGLAVVVRRASERPPLRRGQSAAARALGDGYRVEVRVVVWDEDNVLKVPVGSPVPPFERLEQAQANFGKTDGKKSDEWLHKVTATKRT